MHVYVRACMHVYKQFKFIHHCTYFFVSFFVSLLQRIPYINCISYSRTLLYMCTEYCVLVNSTYHVRAQGISEYMINVHSH